MDQAEINKMYSEVRGKQREFDAIIAQFENQKPTLEDELETLKKGLPLLLAGSHIGEVPKGELARAKKRIKEINEWLDDFGSTCEGLRIFRVRKFFSEGRKISHLERNVQAYERLKKRFEQKPSIYFEKELFDMAENLDCLEEAKKWLEDLRKDHAKS